MRHTVQTSTGMLPGGMVRPMKKPDTWGPALAALTLGLLAIMICTVFYFGIRGLF